MDRSAEKSALRRYFLLHPRNFEENWYVYPVVSRRAGGVSIGVNLNPDRICNFDCIYCQVDRRGSPSRRAVVLPRLKAELDDMLESVLSGQLFQHPNFREVPATLRAARDIAFSGDGEPTSCPQFVEAVQLAANARANRGLTELKLVLITNASLFHRENVRKGLRILDANNGEIWAKLDAGTEEYYRLVARANIKFSLILENITQAARERPVVIQSLFMRIHGQPPSAGELQAYCDRLNEILSAGGKIKLVQIYTVARRPAESFVTPLDAPEIQWIAQTVEQNTRVPIAVFLP